MLAFLVPPQYKREKSRSEQLETAFFAFILRGCFFTLEIVYFIFAKKKHQLFL